MSRQGLTKSLFNLDRVPANILLLILFTILIIFVGASISIQLFTYTNTIKLVESNQQEILTNKELNNIIINNTREVPLQNKAILEDLSTIVNFLGANFNQSFLEGVYQERITTNQTLQAILQNQKLLAEHVNATTDLFGTASHETTPQLRNALYAVAASNPTVTKDSFTNQLDELLQDLNQSTTIIQDLQEQVRNLSTQIPENESEDIIQQEFGSNSAFPFAQNRVERADTPENESMLKEPEGGTIAGFPPQK